VRLCYSRSHGPADAAGALDKPHEKQGSDMEGAVMTVTKGIQAAPRNRGKATPRCIRVVLD
jgi:hypothetical protein